MNDMTLTIKGLFGHFDYEIPLYGLGDADSFSVSDGVTILTGPNGYGKSTILRSLEAISKGDLEFFANLKFQALILSAEEEYGNLVIQKTKDSLTINKWKLSFEAVQDYGAFWDKLIQINKSRPNAKQIETSSIMNPVFRSLISSLFNAAIHGNGENYWSTLPFSGIPEEVSEELKLRLKRIESISAEYQATSDDMDARKFQQSAEQLAKVADMQLYVAQYINRVSLIQEQRLLEVKETMLTQNGQQVKSKDVTETVTRLPSKLKNQFSAASDRYLKIEKKLSGTFPSRVLSQLSDSNLTQEEFDRLYQEMNRKLYVLQENGISDFEQQDIPAFHEEKSGGLRVFFDDFNEKYKAYEPLIEKLTLFRKILDRRFRDFKRVKVSSEYGLRVRDIGGDVIPLEKLSSGEQETLVLYYQLIFETAPGTMLLIDEPEISLHIAWQRHFIDELKEIVRLNGLRAVVATHSASIIGRHRDIQVDLGALYQDELERQEELHRQGA